MNFGNEQLILLIWPSSHTTKVHGISELAQHTSLKVILAEAILRGFSLGEMAYRPASLSSFRQKSS